MSIGADREIQDLGPVARFAADRLVPTLDPQQRAWLDQILAGERRLRGTRHAAKLIDHEKRTLVGPRLPRETADRYRAAAYAAGMSLYAWSWNAMETQWQRQMDGERIEAPWED